MFNNLIESSSHARELKRRGSFLLFTAATYVVLFVVTGVVSIYAYDAHLEVQQTEIELLTFVPEPPPEVAPEVIRNTIPPSSTFEGHPTRSERTDLIDSTSNPNNLPDKIGTVASDVPPARPDSILSNRNADPPTPVFTGNRSSGGSGDTPMVEMPDTPPPPDPKPSPVVPKTIRVSKVLNSQALSLPKPNYPSMAKQIRVQGTVTVQVLIDEGGTVISAKAVSGHPLLVPEAQKAAMMARFSPTVISDQPVKISGVITYNFLMQ
jgi:protein TonB